MSRLLTWVLRLLPVLGIVLALVGVGVFGGLPDSWWDPKGFIINLASGFTAACFGIPLAVLVLQKLVGDRDRIRRRATLQEMVRTGLVEIRLALDKVVEGNKEDIDSCIEKIEITEWELSRLDSIDGIPDVPKGSIVYENSGRLKSAQRSLQYIRDEISELWDSDTAASERWDLIRTRWKFLATNAIPQARLEGFYFLSDELQRRIDLAISKPGPPDIVRRLYSPWRLAEMPVDIVGRTTHEERPDMTPVSVDVVWQLHSSVGDIEGSLKEYLLLLEDLDLALDSIKKLTAGR